MQCFILFSISEEIMCFEIAHKMLMNPNGYLGKLFDEWVHDMMKKDKEINWKSFYLKIQVMKRFLFIICALFTTMMLYASGVESIEETSTGSEIVLNLGTFAGIVTAISTIVTQIFKVIPSIDGNKIAKIGISMAVGIILCFISWALKISEPLMTLSWWQTLIYGISAGLSGCGFYDVIKAIWEMISGNKKE